MNVAQVFQDAVRLASESAFVPEDPEKSTRDIVVETTALQAQLRTRIMGKFSETVLAAAGLGRCYVDVLAFGGTEKYEDDYSFLFLIKGARDDAQRNEMGAAGFVPLLETLRHELAPFEVRHTWAAGSNKNKITVLWPKKF